MTSARKSAETVSLRLKVDATVRGELRQAGTVHEFTPAEARARLLASRYWEVA